MVPVKAFPMLLCTSLSYIDCPKCSKCLKSDSIRLWLTRDCPLAYLPRLEPTCSVTHSYNATPSPPNKLNASTLSALSTSMRRLVLCELPRKLQVPKGGRCQACCAFRSMPAPHLPPQDSPESSLPSKTYSRLVRSRISTSSPPRRSSSDCSRSSKSLQSHCIDRWLVIEEDFSALRHSAAIHMRSAPFVPCHMSSRAQNFILWVGC